MIWGSLLYLLLFKKCRTLTGHSGLLVEDGVTFSSDLAGSLNISQISEQTRVELSSSGLGYFRKT